MSLYSFSLMNYYTLGAYSNKVVVQTTNLSFIKQKKTETDINRLISRR